MRVPAIAATLLLMSASMAVAAPAQVIVGVSPDLQKKFARDYGQRESDLLTKYLRAEVETALARTSAHQDARVELVLEDVKPNRPTYEQLGNTPGLSLQSFGVGGATIEGRVVGADGSEQPLTYAWYETDIRRAWGQATWTDAERAFDRFARKLSRGEELAKR
jgi:hypothetical protein